eukprot:9495417-Pyramimonas_sp.AAC.1
MFGSDRNMHEYCTLTHVFDCTQAPGGQERRATTMSLGRREMTAASIIGFLPITGCQFVEVGTPCVQLYRFAPRGWRVVNGLSSLTLVVRFRDLTNMHGTAGPQRRQSGDLEKNRPERKLPRLHKRSEKLSRGVESEKRASTLD